MVDSGDEELGATTLGPNDYVMVKFAFKKVTRYCVVMIVKPADEFAIPDIEDIVDLPFDDIVARWPVLTVMDGTTPAKKVVVFSVHLSQYFNQ